MFKRLWKSGWLAGALIVLLTVVAYLPAMRGGFIWDDDAYVTENQTLRSAKGLRQIWLNPKETVQYYPLTFTVFWVECRLWGLHPFGFHLVNVLLQAINAILFWRLLSGLRVPGAWWAAAVFALHPVHVMSVAWITELKNVLSGFFYLAALLSYVRFCGLDGHGEIKQARPKWFYGLALALYACALLSKTSTSIFPVAILLILWWKRGGVKRKELGAVLPFVVVGILFGVFTLWLEKYEKGASGEEFTLPFLSRVLVAGRSFWFCLSKLFWPVRLTFFYPRWRIDPTVVWSYVYPLGAVALLAALWWARRRLGRAPLTAMIYFALAFPALVMVEMLYMMRYSFVSDHWQYLGSMGVIPIGVSATVAALNRWKLDLSKLGFVIGTIVLAGLGFLTWQQGHIYRDLETFWRDTLAKNPGAWIAHYNLANTLARQSKTSEAMAEYKTTLRLKPDYAEAHNNLGVALASQGRIEEAIAEYAAALRIRPYAEARYNWGVDLASQGKIEEAMAQYREALRLRPDWPPALSRLAWILATDRNAGLRNGGEAVPLAERLCAVTGYDRSDALDVLAAAYAEAGRFGEALRAAQKAIELEGATGQTKLAQQIQGRLTLYQTGHPFHEN